MKNETYDSGVRCGHIDGQARVGVYVLGEEHLVELEGATPEFERGYAVGYRLGAEGAKLPHEFQYFVERKPKAWA